MASGSIGLGSNQAKANGRIDWQGYSNQGGNYSDVNAQVYVVLSGYGIQGTGSGQWKENGNTVNTFSPYVNIGWGGSGTVQVFTKNGIRVNHNDNGDAGITLGCDMQFGFAGVSNIGGAAWCQMDHIPRYAVVNIGERSKTLNTISINWNTDVPRDWTQYSLNGGGWTNAGDIVSGDNRNGYFTISNLEPNKSYSVKVTVKRTDSQLWSESGTIYITTYDIAKITEAPNIIIGEDATIKYSNPSGALTEVGIFKTDGITNIVPYKSISDGIYTFKFTESENNLIYSFIPNDTKIILRYYIKTTQNGIGYLSFIEKEFSINEQLSKPLFSNFIFKDINTITKNLTGNDQIIIPKYSNVQVTVPIANKAISRNYATMLKYQFDIVDRLESDYSSTLDVSQKFTPAKGNIITVFAVDSRGLSIPVIKNASKVDYTEPIINSTTNLKRVNGIGESVQFIFNGTFWSNNFGNKLNNIKSIKYKQKLSTSNNWDSSEWITIPTSKYKINGSNITNIDESILTGFTIGFEYDVKFRMEDELSYIEFDTSVSSGEPSIAVNKTKKIVGIGKIPDKALPKGSLDVKGIIIMEGKPLITYEVIEEL